MTGRAGWDGNSWAIVAGVAVALSVYAGVGLTRADGAVLSLRAAVVGVSPPETMTVTVFRWSTDAERAPLLAALVAPPPAAAPAGPAAGGRGGRGGRGRGGGAPASPSERLATAVKAAPTVGYIWADGVTGYSIKYAWRGPAPDGGDRVVLATDRRIGAHWPGWPQAAGEAADAEFTVIELRLDGAGAGIGKASLATAVAVDAAAGTIVLDGYANAPALLETGP